MGKTRDVFKKIGDANRTFQAKMSTIKDRNGMDLKEAEDIKKMWKEYTEELSSSHMQSNAQNPSILSELRTSRCSSWI